MFCNQCEQTAGGTGCDKWGVCGKSPDVAALQDLLVYVLTGLAKVALKAKEAGINDPETGVFTSKALFSTLTNVDFDPERFPPMIRKAAAFRDALLEKLQKAGIQADFLRKR